MIIQNNVGNKHSPTVIIASITSKTGVKAKLPTHYYIDAEDGLELPSIVLLEQLRTVDKRRLGNFIGHLSEKHICGINQICVVHSVMTSFVYLGVSAYVEVKRQNRIKVGERLNTLRFI